MNTPNASNSQGFFGASLAGARAIPLPRGEACLSCRRRKMKCDAGKPACAPCTRAGRAGECEYEDSRFLATIAGLEGQVRALQGRIRELEGDAPFSAFLPAKSASASPPSYTAPPPAPALQPQSQQKYHHHQAASVGHDWQHQDQNVVPLQVLRQQLITQFAPRASEFGLPRSSVPFLGHHAGLTDAFCAFTSYISSTTVSPASPASTTLAITDAFVLSAEAALAQGAPNPTPHAVQATALLARLAFARGRAMEGQRHLGAALRVGRVLQGMDHETWKMVQSVERDAAPASASVGGGGGSGSGWDAFARFG